MDGNSPMTSHKEIRLSILNTLYSKYYSKHLYGLSDTDTILKEAFPGCDDFTRIYPELQYLEEESLIYGKTPAGNSYPLYIKITKDGIDEVESYNEELQSTHYLRRIKILDWLYKQYFDGKHGDLFLVKDIAKATGHGDSVTPEFLMELNYLYEKGLIKARSAGGYAVFMDARITSHGIDTVESIVEQSIEEMSKNDDPKIQSNIREISQESDIGSKIAKVLKFTQEIKEWLDVFIRVASIGLG